MLNKRDTKNDNSIKGRYAVFFGVMAVAAALLGYGGVNNYSLAMVGKVLGAVFGGLAVLCYLGTKRKQPDSWER